MREERFFLIIKWVIFIMWKLYHKKCKTSFPFLIGNFCMGLLPYQITCRLVHLQFCFHYFKKVIFTVFSEFKYCIMCKGNWLMDYTRISYQNWLGDIRKKIQWEKSFPLQSLLVSWTNKRQNFQQIRIFNLRELTEVLHRISFW